MAREAGVSVATVSRALRDLPNVAPSTRSRVREVADELSYRADPSAARLATGRTNLVQVVTPTVDGWYFSRFLAGAVEYFTAHGYEAIARPIEDPGTRDDFLSSLLELEKRVDGLVLVDLNIPESAATSLYEAGIRVVTSGFATQRFPSRLISDYRVGFLATEHLVHLGHRRIGLISGQPNHPLAFSVPDLRRAGYAGALAAARIPVETELERNGLFTALGGRAAMEELLALPEPPTAVFAMTDEMAFGALRAAFDAGKRVPADVAVIGVDDHELAELAELSTVRLFPRRLGAESARVMLELIDSEDGNIAETPTTLEEEWFELVVRGSTIA